MTQMNQISELVNNLGSLCRSIKAWWSYQVLVW